MNTDCFFNFIAFQNVREFQQGYKLSALLAAFLKNIPHKNNTFAKQQWR
jgi:hypothetical protein